METERLIEAASRARDNAHCPYSKFAVGAALLTASGEIYAGCNVENVSFGLTNCAERTALFAAVAAGERRFTRIAVVTGTSPPVSPCGACRQALAEFAPDIEVIMANPSGEVRRATLRDLLPLAFENFPAG